MRVGTNPAKHSRDLPGVGRHRIIVPVYLPHFDGYFRHGLEILSLCLESLHLTTAHGAAVSVVSNGCAPEVVDRLRRWFDAGWFDQLIVHQTNRGKVDAAVSVARGAFEPFLTIADCDVLFKQGWLAAVDGVFDAFPEAGFVSPFPAPGTQWYHTSATLLGALVRRELRFADVVDQAALTRFGQSIGRLDWVAPEFRRAQLVVHRGATAVCVGAGHFVCTLRREIVAHMPAEASLMAVEGNSETRWFDEPPDRLGFWRVSTPQAWVSHMGNQPEPWMHEELGELSEAVKHMPARAGSPPPPTAAAGPSWPRHLPLGARRKIVQAMQARPARRLLFRLWGYPDAATSSPPRAAAAEPSASDARRS